MSHSAIILSLSLLLLAASAAATAITGWWTGAPGALTPHFAVQARIGNHILHSACNSNGTPIFPTKEPHKFKLTAPPRAASPVAVIGYYDPDKKTRVAHLFYQTTDGNLTSVDFDCNWDTGDYEIEKEGASNVLEDAGAPSVHEHTGLAVVELGDYGGQRLYYHDKDKRTNLLAYEDPTDWRYLGPVSMMEVAGMKLAAVQTDGTNVSVVFPHDSKNLAVARFYEKAKNKWLLSSVPTPFKDPVPTNNTKPDKIGLDYSHPDPFAINSSDAGTVPLGIASDPDHVLSIFYIGIDKKLHEITETDDGQWRVANGSEDQDWPEAGDDPDIAVISPMGEEDLWIFYQSDHEVVQLHRKNGTWMKPANISTKGGNSGGSHGHNMSNKHDDAALTTGAKAGIGAGIAAGVLLGGAVLFLVFRRRKKAAETEEKPPGYQNQPQELPSNADRTFELVGDTPMALQQQGYERNITSYRWSGPGQI